MPFTSEKQRRYMHIHEPELAAKWEAEAKRKGEPAVQPKKAAKKVPAKKKAAEKGKK